MKREALAGEPAEAKEGVHGCCPDDSAKGTPLSDLRSAARDKVASIGTVNPRPPGAINSLVQVFKRLIARLLYWHVREQVEFNRGVLEELDDVRAHWTQWAQWQRELEADRACWAQWRRELEADRAHWAQWRQELDDVRAHWARWRQEWEHKLSVNEIQFLRSVADLEGAYQHRVTLIESNFRELVKIQHADFNSALDRSGIEIQKRLWSDLERMRNEFEKLIFTELRLIRQRAVLAPPPCRPLQEVVAPAFDYARFAERFRGSRQHVGERQDFYVPLFRDRSAVLDLGCGRGEFLSLCRENSIAAHGVDSSAEFVAVCRSSGLEAECADIFAYLDSLPDATLDGIFCAHVVEHLPPERIPQLIRLASAKLFRNGLLVVETPNPECLAVFSTQFYLDPTHTRPVPSALLGFYMEECGLGKIEVHSLSPAVEASPALASLPEEFRAAFFGGLDYAILGVKH